MASESVVVGIAGAGAGVVVGVVMAGAVAASRSWHLVSDRDVLWLAFAQGVTASGAGALIPALRAARLDPAEILGRA